MGLWFFPDTATLAIFFFCFVLTVLGCWYFLDQGRRYQQRLRKRLTALHGEGRPASKESLLQDKGWSEKSIINLFKKFHFLESLHTLLLQANLRWRLETFLALMACLGAGLGGLGFTQWGFPGGVAGAALGLFLPYKALQLKKKYRLRKFEKQLPDALDLMARGMRAGHAITTGFQLVAVEMANPIGGEFFKTFKEYNHGLDLNLALNNLCQRIPLRDLSFFTIAVMIQRETGGNLAEILEKISSLIRERFKLRNQIKALTAEGRLSGLILVFLPPATAIVLFSRAPEHILLLAENPLGRTMALTALFLQLLGIFVIRNIVNIKM
ncbi:MAG: pilus assembly protein TadB [Deltaproteobacteria bacterium]|nr:pilus assembly protein TadB [Deltaproteobacteria bacterium]